MAKLEQFDLPKEPFRHLSYLAAKGNRIAYTLHTPDPRIGVLRLDREEAREFTLPYTPGIYQFHPHGVIWRGHTIFASCASGPLVSLTPGNRKAIYYEGTSRTPWLASHNLALDKHRNIWLACYFQRNPSSGLISGLARLRPGRLAATLDYWIFPKESIHPFDIWADDDDRIWFSVSSRSSSVGQSTRASIGCLDHKTGTLNLWRIMDGLDPIFLGISGLSGSDEIWFTRKSPSAVYRLNISTGQCEEFSHQMMHGPHDISVDSNGDAWFTSSDGHINTIARKQQGVKVNIRDWTYSLDSYRGDLTITNALAKRLPVRPAPFSRTKELPINVGPFTRWPPTGPGNSIPVGICPGIRDNLHWFTDDARNRIGLIGT